jgi:hypothetical protein
MSSGEVDRIPVSQLIERYSLVKSAVYERFKILGIVPEKVGIKSYVNAEQINLLDKYHQFIQNGGNKAEFREMYGGPKAAKAGAEMPDSTAGLSTVQPDMVQLVAAIAAQIAAKLQPATPEPDPLAYYKALEEAAKSGWHLKTSEICYLLDLTPQEIKQYGDRFNEAGFMFTQVGYRSKGEVAWKVTKPVK